MQNLEAFARNMVQTRERLGWSRAEFLRQLEDAGYDFHMTTIRRLESGEKEPKLDEAYQIASVLGVTIELMLLDPKGQEELQEVQLALAQFKEAVRKAMAAMGMWNRTHAELLSAISRARKAKVPDKVLFDAAEYANRWETYEVFLEQIDWGVDEARQNAGELDYIDQEVQGRG